MEQAAGLLTRVGGTGLMLMNRVRTSGQQGENVLATQVEVLVAKIRMAGPVTMRQLVRSYHRARVSRVQPAIEAAMEAMEAGLVRADEEGRYAVAAG